MKTKVLGEFHIYINDGNYGGIYPEKELFQKSGIPFISASDFTGRVFNYEGIKYISEKLHFELLTKGHLKINDIVIVVRGNGIGKVGFFKDKIGECNMNAQLAFIRTDPEELNSLYLYYLLSSKKYLDLLKRFGTGSAQPQLPINRLKLVPIVYSDISIQQKISSVLSALDSKIELNNKINAELEQMAKTLYDYWFVQFDFPDKNGKPYKSSGGKMVYNKELKREIPERWRSDKMSDWINLDKSGDWGKSEIDGNYTEKVICIRGADINGLNGLDELNPPVRYILKKNSSKILKSHDIVIEISGGSPTQSTGRMAFITDATIKRFDCPLICSNFCKPVSIKNRKLLYNFVYYWNSLYESGAFFGYEGKTSGIKNLLLDSFVSSYYTVIPGEKIVDQFYSFMESVQEKKQVALSENQKLIELRDWLLPMLMNGQVKVK